MPENELDPSDVTTDPGTPVEELWSAASGREGTRPPRARWRRVLWQALLAGGLVLVLGAGAVVGLFWYYGRSLPSFDTMEDYRPLQTTHVYAADGKTLVGEFFEERRTVVPIDQIPPVMIQAIVSAEDKNFFRHAGIDYFGIFKAFLHDLRPGAHIRGASTLTQQIVKTMLLSNKRRLSRKIKEAILAHRLEQKLSKQQILYLYLNQIYFGHLRYGIEEASRYYFGKSAKDLTVGEAAALAAIPKDPNGLNPKSNPKRAKARQIYVLDEMVKNGYLSRAVADREIARPIVTAPDPPKPVGAYYLDEVRRRLVAKFGEKAVDDDGLQVVTMMDPTLQRAAEAAVQAGLRAVDKRQGYRGPSGQLDEDLWSALRPLVAKRFQQAIARKVRPVDPRSVLDLSSLDLTALKHQERNPTATAKLLAALARQVRWAPLATGTEVVARVEEVAPAQATVDLGTTEAVLPLSTSGWARKFDPALYTPRPRSMRDLVEPGDLVRVRIARITPCAGRARARKRCHRDRVEVALEQIPKVQGALVAIDPATRGVVALVGGYDEALSSFNRATQAMRQPGSSFKPFVYATALRVGQARALLPTSAPEDVRKRCIVFQPRATVDDTPVPIRDKFTGKVWSPQDYERGVFEGPMSMRQALAESKNTVAVKLIGDIGCLPATPLSFDDMEQHGLDLVKQTAYRAGIDSRIPDSITAALGTGEVTPLELTNAYATFAMEGRYAPPVLIKEVLSASGQVLYQNNTQYQEQPPLSPPGQTPFPPSPRGLRPDVAFVTSQMMRGVVEDSDGTAHFLLQLGRPIAGKTGTSSGLRDGWFLGFTPEMIAGAWVGFDDHGMLGHGETGARTAGPIWLGFMKVAEAQAPPAEWMAPAGVVTAQIDPRTGLLAGPHSPFVATEYYLAGTEPNEVSPPDSQVTTEDYFRSQAP